MNIQYYLTHNIKAHFNKFYKDLLIHISYAEAFEQISFDSDFSDICRIDDIWSNIPSSGEHTRIGRQYKIFPFLRIHLVDDIGIEDL